MASVSNTSEYKQYGRRRRQATLQDSFTSGMMFTSGAVEEGYVQTLVNYEVSANSESLVPRPGLKTEEILLPSCMLDDYNNAYNIDSDITIKAARECTEADGNTYRQFLLGKAGTQKLWVVTGASTEGYVERAELPNEELKYSLLHSAVEENDCAYFTVPLSKVHGMDLAKDSKVSSVIGTFAFGNSFYYIDPIKKLYKYTSFDSADKVYKSNYMTPKVVSPSEAVAYGYNALLGNDMYSFTNNAYPGVIQLTGILPYSTTNTSELLLNPRKNEDILFRCHFNGKVGNKYKFVWEWRTLESNTWESLVSFDQAIEYEIVAGDNGTVKLAAGGNTLDSLEVVFKAPAESIMVRVQAFNSEEYTNLEEGHDPITEAAMNVGFDFTVNSENKKQVTYDLTTATGMTYWKNRLIVWGIPKDPTVLFFSDYDEPLYFPYPNNVSIFDEPIVDAKVYMDSLLVFTTSKVYQLTTVDGTSWKQTILQSNLNIEPWDRHLIHIVRNMVFFKSGNYYFMIVPKAQSTTGELTLAPISIPIKDLFNDFKTNVKTLLKSMFNIDSTFEIIDYFNYLDYEDMHNIYILKIEGLDTNLYFDVVYNTVTRVWRILTYEAKNLLYPYKHDATQTGTLASTSIIELGRIPEFIEYEPVSLGASEEIVNSIYLTLSQEGYSFETTEPLIVQVTGPDGAEFLNAQFNVLKAGADDYEFKYTADLGSGVSIDLVFNTESYTNDFLKFYLYKANDLVGFPVGSTITIYKASDLSKPIYGPQMSRELLHGVYVYPFKEDSITLGSVLEVDGIRYSITDEDLFGDYDSVYTSDQTDLFSCRKEFTLDGVFKGYRFYFSKSFVNAPIITLIPTVTNKSLTTGRCIQLHRFDNLSALDYDVCSNTNLIYCDSAHGHFNYLVGSIKETLEESIKTADDRYTFNNWQYLDTGYRRDNTHVYKRFRELQIQLNNIEGSNLEFGLEFFLDGERRLTHLAFETEYSTDETDSNYGVIYVETSPIENVSLVTKLDVDYSTTKLNTWTLNQSLFPELSLWKVRIPVSGKGLTPRLRLLSKNSSKFEIAGINWIYRIMNMR